MKSRPPGYEQAVSIDLSKSPVLAVVLTLAGFGLFFLLGWLGLRLLTILRPDVQSLTLRVSGLGSGLLFLAGLIVLIALTVTLHELVHGVFFSGSSLASAPNWVGNGCTLMPQLRIGTCPATSIWWWLPLLCY
jgi:hypothetical protein